jgi:uncharacterized membrane protein HdeD (DUF308 family)
MDSHIAESYLDTIASRWWSPVIRGVAAILFGIVSLAMPGVSLAALVLLWAAYAIIDGGFNIALAVQRGQAGTRWGWFLFEGLVSIAAGLLAVAWPAITAVVLLFVIAAWAVATGISEIFAAFTLRGTVGGAWQLGIAGVLSIVFGALLFAQPGAGALAVVWIISVYAITFGVLLVALGLRLHRWHARHDGVPTEAATLG